jgi:hypothetical protein
MLTLAAHIVDRRTWLLPAWLDRLLPRLNIDGAAAPALLAAAHVSPAPSWTDAGARQPAGAAAGRAEG